MFLCKSFVENLPSIKMLNSSLLMRANTACSGIFLELVKAQGEQCERLLKLGVAICFPLFA